MEIPKISRRCRLPRTLLISRSCCAEHDKETYKGTCSAIVLGVLVALAVVVCLSSLLSSQNALNKELIKVVTDFNCFFTSELIELLHHLAFFNSCNARAEGQLCAEATFQGFIT